MDNITDKKIKIRTCPVCKQEIQIKPGMDNWKNLFRKPTLEEWITLFLLISVLALYYVYKYDINQYENIITNLTKRCALASSPSSSQINTDIPIPSLSINETKIKV
jgi:hypothetical protein